MRSSCISTAEIASAYVFLQRIPNNFVLFEMASACGEMDLSILTKTDIKLGLSLDEYVIVPNNRARSADVWMNKHCGLVAVKSRDETNAEPQVIPGFAACFKCKEVFSFEIGGSHSQLSRHAGKCSPREPLPKIKNIGLMDKFVSRKLPSKLEKKLLEACAAFVSVDMQSFKAVEGSGL